MKIIYSLCTNFKAGGTYSHHTALKCTHNLGDLFFQYAKVSHDVYEHTIRWESLLLARQDM